MGAFTLIIDVSGWRRASVPLEAEDGGDPWRLAVMVLRLCGPVARAEMREGGKILMEYEPVVGWRFSDGNG